MRRYSPTAGPSDQPRHVCVVVIGEAEQSVERLLQQEHCDWQAVVVPSADGVTFDWSDLHEALAADVADTDIVVFVSAAAILRPHTVAVLTDALAVNADAIAAYGDLEVIHGDGRSMPVFFGAFDYERLLEQGYAAHCFALRPTAISIPEGESTGSLSRLFMTLFDAATENLKNVVHSPGVLAAIAAEHIAAWAPSLRTATAAHLQRRGVQAAVDEVKGGVFPAIRIKRAFDRDALVSIVVPTRDRVDLLSACLESVRAKTEGVRYEIVIVDNDSATPEAIRYLAECEHRGDRLVSARGDFNYSRFNNLGVEAARGEFICLLNNDTEVLDDHWLEELMGRLAEPDVGAAAPMLLWPNRMVQHGGIVLGPNFAASNAFNDCMEGDAGYGDQLCVARECGAVTAACLLTRRSDYEALGGLDALAFPVLFNDVDYCLRLRADGKRIIFTPHAKLIHREAASRAQDESYDRSSRFRRELRQLRNRWGDALASDSAYSPMLNLDPYPFSALAWPPRNARPRLNRPVKAVRL
jgi:GT2 family glycosyltransferase